MTAYTLEERLRRAAELVAQGMTPARRESLVAGAGWLAQVFAEVGVQGALGENVRSLAARLERSTADAQQTLRRLESVAYDPADVDARGRAVLALTGSLLKAFDQRPSGASPVSGARYAPDERVQQQIVRAVSYIVWAYLSGGAPLPVSDEPSGEEGGR